MTTGFFKISSPCADKVAPENVNKVWKRKRLQSFIAITLGYALFYVCRLSMGVMKQPLIDAGLLSATQLGIIGACMFWSYAVGKLINGFLADGANVKRFMATGLAVSAVANLIMGLLGVLSTRAALLNGSVFVIFAIMWTVNGWVQSMGAPPSAVTLSRWFPVRIRGTYYGFFSASHNIGEGLSFIFVGSIVAAFGWRWGFFGAALAGFLGVALILAFLHDTPESNGLPSIETMSGESDASDSNAGAGKAEVSGQAAEVKKIQRAVLRTPAVWILALSSAFMYMSRYAINEWGIIFLQESNGYDLKTASAMIGLNPIFGIAGTVLSGWLSDVLFKGSRKWPAFIAGVLEAIALWLFLFGNGSRFTVILSMVLFGLAIGVLISFLGGLMAIDIVPRKATGAAMGVVGIASYAAAGAQNIVTGVLMDGHTTQIINELGQTTIIHDFSYVRWFWLGAAIISFLLPILNWRAKKQL